MLAVQSKLTSVCSFDAWLRKDGETLGKVTEVKKMGGQKWELHLCKNRIWTVRKEVNEVTGTDRVDMDVVGTGNG